MPRRNTIPWLVAWAAAFGACEGAVVVYLRRLCYPGQPDTAPVLPLHVVDPTIFRVEQVREAATLLMLLAVAVLAERRPIRRFAAFALCFGTWDLVYYATLHAALGWPVTILDWDVLFLIPRPWTAPVLAPVLVSLALVGASCAMLVRIGENAPNPFRARDWGVEIACGALVIASFFWSLGPVARGGLPEPYPWWLFLAGWLGGLAWFARRLLSQDAGSRQAVASEA